MVPYASLSLVVARALACGSPWLPTAQGAQRENSSGSKLTIRVGDKEFIATLLNNPTAAAFRALLPLSIPMTELNANEKYAGLPGPLPTQASRPPSIRTGDLMLYGSNTLVLFCKSFTTTYTYTKIGQVDDPAGLEAALGAGNVAVTFEARRER